MFVILACLLVTVFLMNREFQLLEQRRIEREKKLQEWLFKSLYSINQKVLLPDEHEVSVVQKKASVYSPSEDKMSEFTGGDNGWFE